MTPEEREAAKQQFREHFLNQMKLYELLDTGNAVKGSDTDDVEYITLINKSGKVLFHDNISLQEFKDNFISHFEYVKELDIYSNKTFLITK